MIKPDRVARRQFPLTCLAVLLFTANGCAEMLPSEETWEKWSPGNIWFYLQPHQLSRLSEQQCEPISDVYYSVSDWPEHNRPTVRGNRSSDDDAMAVVVPVDVDASAQQAVKHP